MKTGINLGRSDSNSFKESKSVAITKLHLEKGRRIKTHFLEMDKTPNFDGKLMILDGDIERITVEVQIKTLPERVRFQDNGDFSFICDTKAMNCVLGKVTLNPVALFAVDTVRNVVYYKLLTRDYVLGLDIGIKKEVTIKFSRTDIFCEDDFISRVCQEVKITNTYTDCIIECTTIRKILRCAQYTYKEKYQLVYQRNEVKGFLRYIDMRAKMKNRFCFAQLRWKTKSNNCCLIANSIWIIFMLTDRQQTSAKLKIQMLQTFYWKLRKKQNNQCFTLMKGNPYIGLEMVLWGS